MSAKSGTGTLTGRSLLCDDGSTEWEAECDDGEMRWFSDRDWPKPCVMKVTLPDSEPRKPSSKWESVPPTSGPITWKLDLGCDIYGEVKLYGWRNQKPDPHYEWRVQFDFCDLYGGLVDPWESGESTTLEAAQVAAEDALRALLADALKELDRG